ncbi:MAG: rhodanese-like domain-containing protein [Erythrobacter sp.]|uniref:rhodanese-like domain-containing protein n=1 Tax=Erythrobacter sp. TaxID=1042 RepID=UPI00262500A5|nr:rhodanese-like domain-containing protein [Erythrobacter sp.]MDJ0979294.1 rhodanese-like domain-containing protein [Erythrobacter sp.]
MRAALLAGSSGVLLGLAGCVPEDGESDSPSLSPLPGFELAAAQTIPHEIPRMRDPGAGQFNLAGLIKPLDAKALGTLVKQEEVFLIDVRTPEEFAEGHMSGAVNVPLDGFDPLYLPDSGGREVILYCRSGRRSWQAAYKYASTHRIEIRHLEGGILAWEQAGYSVVTP